MIVVLQLDGHSNHEIAWVLNYYGFRNPKTGRKWNPTGVKFAHRKSKAPLIKTLGPILGPKPRPKPRGKVKKLWNHLVGESKKSFDGLRGGVAPFLVQPLRTSAA